MFWVWSGVDCRWRGVEVGRFREKMGREHGVTFVLENLPYKSPVRSSVLGARARPVLFNEVLGKQGRWK